MRSRWPIVRLADLCSYRQERILVSQLTTSNYVSTANMIPDKGGVEVAENLPSTKTTNRYYAGDVLISNIRPYFKKAWFATENGGCSNDVLVMQAKGDVDSAYLYYVLTSDSFFAYMCATSKGTKMPRGDKGAIMSWRACKPPLSEQQAISKTLSCLDAKIQVNNRISQNLEQQAQAIFKSWFVDFEPFQDGGFVSSEIGMIPEGWHAGRLEDIAKITMGQSPKGSTYNENGLGVVFYQGSTDFGWRFPTRRLYTTEPIRMANKNDILLSVRAPVGTINVANEDCCIGRGLAAIHNANHPSFLFYTMRSIKEKLDQFNAEGTVFGSINQRDLKAMPVIIPPERVIEKFERIVEDYDQLIWNLHRQDQTLASIRDALLPKLMSGEIEVPVE